MYFPVKAHQNLALLVLFACALSACNKADATAPGGGADAAAAPAAPSTPAVEKPEVVHVIKIKTEKLPPTLDLTGTLAADESSDVAAPAPGLLTEVLIDVGSRVKKGDVLAKVDRRDAQMRELQATAATAQAGARLGIKPGDAFNPQKVPEVLVAKQALELAETEAKRAKALVEGGSAAASLWDQARIRGEQARGQYDAAVNGARQQYAALQMARAAQDLTEKASNDTEIRAPFDGVVIEKRVSPGEYAQAGRVIAVVIRDTTLRLKVDVPEADAAKVKIDAQVLVTVAAWPGRVFSGAIKRIGASLKMQSRALPVEAEFANPDGELKPGFFAHASIVVEGAGLDAMLVPATAIGNSGSASRVFAITGDRIAERIVTVGRSWQGLVEIHGNIKVNDEIANDNLTKLLDGAAVVVQRSEPIAAAIESTSTH